MTTGATTIRRTLDKVETETAFDTVAHPVQKAADRLIKGRLRDFFHGVWLGHPLHPALVQVPVGAWTSGSMLDMFPGAAPEATALIGVGTAAALPAAVAGWVDWTSMAPEQRRVGIVHAGANLIAVGLQTASLIARRSGRARVGRRLSFMALAVSSASAYIGGHLTYRHAAGVSHAAPQLRRISGGWHQVCALDELVDGALTVRKVDGVPILLTRDGGSVTAMVERCAHHAGPLGDGEVVSIDGARCVICPWHGSTFRLTDGAVVHGPAATDQPLLRHRVQAGYVEVALP